MRKRIAALLCVSLITGTLALIPTGAAAAGSEISVFDSLSDYTAQKGSGVPAGWISRDANTLKGVGVYLDEERNSRTMKINEGGEVVLPFGNNFNEGLLHISYDVKQIDDNGNNNYNKMLSASLYGHVDTDANGAPDYTHQYDPTYFANGGNPMHYMLTTGTNANGVPFGVFTDSWRWMGRRLYDKDKSFTEDTWHKIDIYLNQTPTAASAYSVYLDGEAIVGRTVTNGVYSDDIMGDFIYDLEEDRCYVNQFADSRLTVGDITVTQKTDYPWSGRVEIVADGVAELYIRIPAWCESFHIDREYTMKNGYAVVKNDRDKVVLEMVMEPFMVNCDLRVAENVNKTAVQCGPVVYCAESIDNCENLHSLFLTGTEGAQVEYDSGLRGNVILLDGLKAAQPGGLYTKQKEEYEKVKVKLIPYYAFANRGESNMLVWLSHKGGIV